MPRPYRRPPYEAVWHSAGRAWQVKLDAAAEQLLRSVTAPDATGVRGIIGRNFAELMRGLVGGARAQIPRKNDPRTLEARIWQLTTPVGERAFLVLALRDQALQTRDPIVTDILLRLVSLERPIDPTTRTQAVAALGVLQIEAALSALHALVWHDAPEVGVVALASIRMIGTSAARDLLTEILRTHPDEEMHLFAGINLTQLK